MFINTYDRTTQFYTTSQRLGWAGLEGDPMSSVRAASADLHFSSAQWSASGSTSSTNSWAFWKVSCVMSWYLLSGLDYCSSHLPMPVFSLSWLPSFSKSHLWSESSVGGSSSKPQDWAVKVFLFLPSHILLGLPQAAPASCSQPSPTLQALSRCYSFALNDFPHPPSAAGKFLHLFKMWLQWVLLPKAFLDLSR